MKQSAFDWRELELSAVNYMVTAVRAVREQFPQERLYGAMFHAFYGDGSVMYWPALAIGTEESLLQKAGEYQQSGFTSSQEQLCRDLRWSAADLPHNEEPDEAGESWAAACNAFALLDGSFSSWEKVYQRFMHVFPKAAKKARKQLLQEGVVEKNFVTFAADEAEELIPLSLSKAQIKRHFPRYDAAEQERQRLAALPVAQQLAELVPQAVGAVEPGLLYGEYDALLKALGSLAVPPLTAVIRGEQPGNAWRACILLAEINEATPEAIAALALLLDDVAADESSRRWAASALARLEQMELVARRIPELPTAIAAGGLSAPYRAFRDRGRHRPLDYRPLEKILESHPQLEGPLADELKPGVGYCSIAPEEAAAAREGLASRWAFIRRHAEEVLEELQDRLR